MERLMRLGQAPLEKRLAAKASGTRPSSVAAQAQVRWSAPWPVAARERRSAQRPEQARGQQALPRRARRTLCFRQRRALCLRRVLPFRSTDEQTLSERGEGGAFFTA